MENLPIIPRSNRYLTDVVDAFGGWAKVLASHNHPTEELLARLSEAGMDHESFMSLRVNARSIFLLRLAEKLYWDWRHLLTGSLHLPRPKLSPFSADVKWTEFPYAEHWLSPDINELFILYNISKNDIELLLTSDKKRFPQWDPPAFGIMMPEDDSDLTPINTKLDLPSSNDIEMLPTEFLLVLMAPLNFVWYPLLHHLMSAVTLVQNEVCDLKIRDQYEVKLYRVGPYCPKIVKDLSEMAIIGLVKSEGFSGGLKFSLHPKGQKLADEITSKLPAKLIVELEQHIRFVNSASFSALVSELWEKYPLQRC